MSLIKRIFNRGLREIREWSLAGGPLRRSLYYRFMDTSFQREYQAVGAGIAEYTRQTGTGEELYLLRRDIHRLEKALTMRPLRDSFALGYIEETVNAYKSVVTGALAPKWVNGEEFKWATSVLVEYFEVTRKSNTPLIQRLEQEFRAIEPTVSLEDCEHGPLQPPDDEVPVSYDALLALAKRRRSVRWFEQRSVDRKLVDNAIRVAQESPTACNRQPYKFHVFDDRESIQKVAEIPMGTAGFRHQIPGIIVVVGDLSSFFDARDRHLIYVDGSLAITGLLLGLESQGISSCSINWPDMRERELAMKKLLKLKDHERVIMLVAYGYADQEALSPYSAKRDLDEARVYTSIT